MHSILRNQRKFPDCQAPHVKHGMRVLALVPEQVRPKASVVK
jgi:hypothetical protein